MNGRVYPVAQLGLNFRARDEDGASRAAARETLAQMVVAAVVLGVDSPRGHERAAALERQAADPAFALQLPVQIVYGFTPTDPVVLAWLADGTADAVEEEVRCACHSLGIARILRGFLAARTGADILLLMEDDVVWRRGAARYLAAALETWRDTRPDSHCLRLGYLPYSLARSADALWPALARAPRLPWPQNDVGLVPLAQDDNVVLQPMPAEDERHATHLAVPVEYKLLGMQATALDREGAALLLRVLDHPTFAAAVNARPTASPSLHYPNDKWPLIMDHLLNMPCLRGAAASPPIAREARDAVSTMGSALNPRWWALADTLEPASAWDGYVDARPASVATYVVAVNDAARRAAMERQLAGVADVTWFDALTPAASRDYLPPTSWAPGVPLWERPAMLCCTRSHAAVLAQGGARADADFVLVMEDDVALHASFWPAVRALAAAWDRLDCTYVSLGYRADKLREPPPTGGPPLLSEAGAPLPLQLARVEPREDTNAFGSQCYMMRRVDAARLGAVLHHSSVARMRAAALDEARRLGVDTQQLQRAFLIDWMLPNLARQALAWPPLAIEFDAESTVGSNANRERWKPFLERHGLAREAYWTLPHTKL